MKQAPQILDRMTNQREKRALITGMAGQKGSEIALLGILVATASIVFEERLPVLSVGIHLQIPDILLLGSLGCIAVRWLNVPGFRIVRTPLDRPLLVFYGVTLFSTLVAIVHSSVGRDQAIAATRVFSYYLTFFVVTNLVRERRQLDFLVNGIFFLATIVAVAMIVQYVLGNAVELLPGRVEALGTQGRTFENVTRIAPPGLSIVLVSFVTTLCILVVEKFQPMGLLRCLQCGLLGVAFLVTFLRSYWAPLIGVIFLMGYLVRGAGRRRLIGWGLWGMVAMSPAVLVLLLVHPDSPAARMLEAPGELLDASWDRLRTLGRSGTFGVSGTFQGGEKDTWVDFRQIENDYALAAIASSPVIGLGMGAAYRPWDSRLDWRGADAVHDLTGLIHNGHLGILLQSGLLGYLSLMWLSFAFLVRGFRNWRRVPNDRMKAVVLGFTLVYLAVLIAAGANSTFMQWHWTPVIGIIMGINEVILRKVRPDEAIA